MVDFNEVTYELLLDSLAAGSQGLSIEHQLQEYEDGGTSGEYTVYWPKDSIRVIAGSDYGTARAVACILRDGRTRWMGEGTSAAEPVIARVRRPLASQPWATTDQVRSSTVYVQDKLLPNDIRVSGILPSMTEAEYPGGPYRFDFSTLPES